VELLGEAGVEVAVAGDCRDPRAHLAHELAVLTDLLVHQAVAVLLDEEAQAAEDRRALLRRQSRPVGLVERAARRADRGVDLLGGGDRNAAPGRRRERVDAGERLAVGGLDPLPVDEHRVVAVEVVGPDVASGIRLQGHVDVSSIVMLD
jgi:hypothetical protein